MQKRHSFVVVVLCSIAMFITAGCATQTAVKKDETSAPVPVAPKNAKSEKTEIPPNRALPTSSDKNESLSSKIVSGNQSGQKDLGASQLQSALDKIYFDFDSADLSESARTALSKNADALMRESSAKIRIEGNCDDRGSVEYNLALGERRAKAAQQYLTTLGVKPERLSIISYGKEKPSIQGNDEASMAKNRRDEFVVISK